MKTYFFNGILQRAGWLENIRIDVNDTGIITAITSFNPNETGTKKNMGYALPGFQNAHSHAFQYAMAGLAERHENSNAEDFWGWRNAMYGLALSLNPDQMEAIATMVYAEMLRHGYTNVAEFHYVHHDLNGKPYTNIAEMGIRLIAAAKTAGIGITLIPIFYQKGGFGEEPGTMQKRFISGSVEEYLKLWEASRAACVSYEHANMGIGVHSMRGVDPANIVELAKSGPQGVPFHIHISEQKKEVEDALKYLGKRPVEWALENLQLNERFHLVHATHMTDEEASGLAKSKAHVVICPSTEGNLGDGLFPLKKYQNAGGKWSIGTDSHVGLNPLEELRLLDYGQRLTTHNRSTFTSKDQVDSGLASLKMATGSGRKAMGNTSFEFFAIGQPLNASIVDATHPLISSTSLQNLTSTIVYTADSSAMWGTISHGKLVIQDGTHERAKDINEEFRSTLKKLKNR